MAFRILAQTQRARRGVLVGIPLACALVVGCSSKADPPKAFISATLEGTMTNPALCQAPGPLLSVGAPVVNAPSTENDGELGGAVRVICSVVPSGSGFDINLKVTQAGSDAAGVEIVSPAGMGAVTSTGGQGVTGVFASASLNYSSPDCTITFEYNGQPISMHTSQPPIAAGRIWGHLSCPTAQNTSGGMAAGPDGGVPYECDAEADFLFEDCSQ